MGGGQGHGMCLGGNGSQGWWMSRGGVKGGRDLVGGGQWVMGILGWWDLG